MSAMAAFRGECWTVERLIADGVNCDVDLPAATPETFSDDGDIHPYVSASRGIVLLLGRNRCWIRLIW